MFKRIALALVILISLQSCEKEDNGNETLISSYGEDESHNAGQDCMSCHKSGGSGEGWFTVAGTVYDSTKLNILPNATIRLNTAPNGGGTSKGTIQVDKKGNFYTTQSIDFGAGLYTSASGNTETHHMLSPINNGNCNSCHGNSTLRVWTK